MDQAKLKDLRDRVLAGGPTNAWRLSECLALLDALQEPRLARNPSTTDFDNTILRNAGVALMQSTDAFNFVEGMTLCQIGQALYDHADLREAYARLLAEVKHLRAEDAMLFHQNAPPSFH